MKRIIIQIDDELLEYIDAAAKAQARSRAGLIRYMIVRCLAIDKIWAMENEYPTEEI